MARAACVAVLLALWSAGPAAGSAVFRELNAPGLAARPPQDPPDVTGAIGRRHYVEVVNAALGVYARGGLRPVIETEAESFWRQPDLTDPQVSWDDEAGRWYYVMDRVDVVGDGFELLFAWSKTPDPTDLEQGWCKFSIPTGTLFDDFPNLGYSRNHILIGTNVFDTAAPGESVFSRIWAIAKPPDGNASCRAPERSAFGSAASPLREADGRRAHTPVPVNPVHPSDRGYVVAADCLDDLADDPEEEGCSRPERQGDQVTVWHVAGPPDSPRLVEDGGIDVPAFDRPDDVPQPGSRDRLEAFDGRLTQAVSNRDPTLGASEAIWTQHTVRGRGGRAELRWYELDPERLSVLRRGAIAKRRRWVFNGAISPTSRGDGAVAHYNVAGPDLLPQIRARARGPGDAASAMRGELVLGRSAAPMRCGGLGITCRWGDYAGATPDPRQPNVVWGSNELLGPRVRSVEAADAPHWRTRNFAIRSDGCGARDPNLIRGSGPGGETLTGTPGEDEILAAAGADTLLGLGAADCLYGDGGPDSVRGGAGDDLLDGAERRDSLRGAADADLLLGGPRGDRLRGGRGADALRGQRGPDSLRSGRGSDRLRGAKGPDRLRGGRGGDRLWGGRGNDVLRGGRGRNRIDCGPGRDRVISLKRARDRIASNCERVTRR